jgi:hypothetical protein
LQAVGDLPAEGICARQAHPPPKTSALYVRTGYSILSRLRLTVALLAAAGLGVSAAEQGRSDPQAPTIPKISDMRENFFSSLVPDRLARLQFAEAEGAHRQMGPFRIATPGVALTDARLEINATPCTPADWAALLDNLAKYRLAQLPTLLVVTLPDGRECLAPRFPLVRQQDHTLVLERAQVRLAGGELAQPQTVVIGWMGGAAGVVSPRRSSPTSAAAAPEPRSSPVVSMPSSAPANPPAERP